MLQGVIYRYGERGKQNKDHSKEWQGKENEKK